MIVDLNHYLVNKPFIQEWHKDHGKGNPGLTVSILSPATHCPCIVMAFYLSETVGFIPEMVDMIQKLIDFYHYTEINHQPENSPFKEYDCAHNVD